MGRIKTAKTISEEVTCIQFVRAAISEVYDFLDNRDMSIYFRNDKFSGAIVNEQGKVLNITGKDWIVKDANGAITIYPPEGFAAHFKIDEETV